MSKYPASERVTAGSLRVGDSILIRERGSDALDLAGQDGIAWTDRRTIPTGIHEITAIESELRRAHRRSSRYYFVTVATLDAQTGQPITVETSQVQRYNRVTESS